jgi:hypothetical protein
MDNDWTEVLQSNNTDIIPPLPTREEEIAYLDKLEKELRSQSYYNSGFPPDPSRKYYIKADKLERQHSVSFKAWILFYGILFCPLSTWLTNKSCAKSNVLGIPYRSYGIQHKVRFWSYFLFYEVSLIYFTYYNFLGDDVVKKSIYPLNQIREKKL